MGGGEAKEKYKVEEPSQGKMTRLKRYFVKSGIFRFPVKEEAEPPVLTGGSAFVLLSDSVFHTSSDVLSRVSNTVYDISSTVYNPAGDITDAVGYAAGGVPDITGRVPGGNVRFGIGRTRSDWVYRRTSHTGRTVGSAVRGRGHLRRRVGGGLRGNGRSCSSRGRSYAGRLIRAAACHGQGKRKT